MSDLILVIPLMVTLVIFAVGGRKSSLDNPEFALSVYWVRMYGALVVVFMLTWILGETGLLEGIVPEPRRLGGACFFSGVMLSNWIRKWRGMAIVRLQDGALGGRQEA